MSNILNENKLVFIAGDFNLEMLKENKTGFEFLAVMNSYNLFPSILENTRITPTSANCLDNIFTNSLVIKATVFENFISDHTAQKVVFEIESKNVRSFNHKRIFSTENKTNFLESLRTENFESVYSVDIKDVNKQWNNFIGIFVQIFNENFPIKKLYNKKKRKVVSPEIAECKNRLDLLLTLSNHNIQYKETYKRIKKEYDNLLKNTQKQKYESRVVNSDNKMKCM